MIGDACILRCGNGVVEGDEKCDSGGFPGCNGDCDIVLGYDCKGDLGSVSICDTQCGDGIVCGDEVCDDGDLLPNNGCNCEYLDQVNFNCLTG